MTKKDKIKGTIEFVAMLLLLVFLICLIIQKGIHERNEQKELQSLRQEVSELRMNK